MRGRRLCALRPLSTSDPTGSRGHQRARDSRRGDLKKRTVNIIEKLQKQLNKSAFCFLTLVSQNILTLNIFHELSQLFFAIFDWMFLSKNV